MKVYEHMGGAYHYYNVKNDDGKEVGGSAVEHDNFMHYVYKEHCKAEQDKCAKIIYVQTNKSERCKGVATLLLNQIIADYKDWDLFLNVRPLDTTQERFGTVQELTKFYEKFGFRRCENPGNFPAMVRPARVQ